MGDESPSWATGDGYDGQREGYDELLGAAGAVRSHWRPLVNALDQLGRPEVRSRAESARRFLHENGVTYNVYSDAQGLERTWPLDPLPLLLPAAEWAHLEAGLIQRTRLLSAILTDLYGPQRLLQTRRLPPALVHANPGFLREARGVVPAGKLPLVLHAVDLARARDGRWWALADRTQAPSGAGYALVNRLAISRAFPDEFRDFHVQRLAAFFQVVRDTLRSLAPANRDHPNVVLLTPGPHNEAYFEHAYLARYLGFPLVEGGDLTVRERRVFIKTLEGLRQVDVILRRVDDNFCDPLELRPDSYLGVPGLMEAARAGHVALANPLGSGLVEAPALLAFLPPLCRELLGEKLLLPSVATWWCGQPHERTHVEAHLEEMVVKRAFPAGSGEPWFGQKMAPHQRADLFAQIQRAPHLFVGQEQVALSTAPVLLDERFEARPLVLRAFICATLEGWQVMPGGLTRVAGGTNRPVVSTQSGGSSKDTWVLAAGPVNPVSLLQPAEPVIRLERRASEVPSRVADNFFWLGRYTERLEDTIRLLRTGVSRLTGEAAASPPPELPAWGRLLGELGLFPIPAPSEDRPIPIEKHLLLLIYQADRVGGVREGLNRVRQTAFVLRDRFTADTWRILNRLQADAHARPGRLPTIESVALLNTLILDLSAFNGMAMENMTRGHGWRFLDLGRRLERALRLLHLLQAASRLDPSGVGLLEPVLETADSVMTHRRRYFARPQWSGVLDLLLADESNPRSLAFQLSVLQAEVAELPPVERPEAGLREPTLLARAITRLQAADVLVLGQAEADGPAGGLIRLLSDLAADLGAVSDALTRHYFIHATPRVS